MEKLSEKELLLEMVRQSLELVSPHDIHFDSLPLAQQNEIKKVAYSFSRNADYTWFFSSLINEQLLNLVGKGDTELKTDVSRGVIIGIKLVKDAIDLYSALYENDIRPRADMTELQKFIEHVSI